MQPRELANTVCEALQNAGFQAFLVGGCVRDLLLGREPADYDVATSATRMKLMLFSDGVTIGAQFRGDPGSARRNEGGSGDISIGRWLCGWAASGSGDVCEFAGGGCRAADFTMDC
jgi:hypothetical protein